MLRASTRRSYSMSTTLQSTSEFVMRQGLERRSRKVFVIPKGTDTSVQGAYTLRKRNINLNEGVVVRSTNGANAAGMLLPTVLTFTGIDLDLKKHPSGVVWVEIAGLSPSAVTTPSMAKTKGYVCLLAEKDAEEIVAHRLSLIVPFEDPPGLHGARGLGGLPLAFLPPSAPFFSK